jgi:hypothetical protein
MTAWTGFGPAEFDKRRMPKGRKPQPPMQAGLFVLAAEPVPAKPAPQPEQLPGQADLFGANGQDQDERCPTGDCRPDPYPPEAMRPARGHWECCGQPHRGPCCQRTGEETAQ